MLWPELIKRASKNDEINLRKFFRSMDLVLKNQQNITAIPRKFHTYIKDIWILQLKLHSRIGKQPYKTLKHPRFRAAYDLGSWWTKFQKNDPSSQKSLISNLRELTEEQSFKKFGFPEELI
jgi:poly(A) polymerase